MSRQNTELSATTAVTGQSFPTFGADSVQDFPDSNFGQTVETETTADGFTIVILNCKREDEILIGDDVRIRVLTLRGHRVRLGIDAPTTIPIARAELCSGELAHSKNPPVRRRSGARIGPSFVDDLVMDLP